MAKLNVRLFTNPAYTTPNVVGSVVATTNTTPNVPQATVLTATTLQSGNPAVYNGVGYNVVVSLPTATNRIKAITNRYNQRYGQKIRLANTVKNMAMFFGGVAVCLAVVLLCK